MALTFIPQTPRDFLASLTPPLAIPNSRGRLSKDAHAALDKARAEGFRFIGDEGHPQTEVKEKKEKKVTTPKATPAPTQTKAEGTTVTPATSHPAAAQASFNAKEVRAWAKANGHEVGERGRIRPEVIAAFAKAGGKPVGPRASRPTPASMPKTRKEKVAYAVERNTVIGFTTCAKQGGCGKPVDSCTHEAPIAPHYLDADVAGKPLSLTKPVV